MNPRQATFSEELDPTEADAPIVDDYGQSDGKWLNIDWRSHMNEIETRSSLGNTPVSYVSMGEGPPLLLVHGLGGSWRNWLENIPALAEHHTVYALDLPGFGISKSPPEEITIAGFGELVIDFAEKLGMGPETALVGHSMGGFISTEAVISSPDRFSSLNLISAAGITFADINRTERSIREFLLRVGLPIFTKRVESNLARKRLRAASFAGVIAHPSRVSREILWELGYYGASAPSLLEGARALINYDTRHRLPEIELPTQIIWGNKDRLVPVSAAYSYNELIKDSELAIFDDTGHMVQLERPEQFNRTLEAFVTSRVD